jgi:hypothetical protein
MEVDQLAEPPNTQAKPARVRAATTHRLLVDLFLAGVVAQFFLAGLAVFSAKPHGSQHFADSSTFDPHRALGNALILVALLIAIAAVIARRHVPQSAVLLGLMILQSAWAAIGSSAPAVAALHVLGAMVIAVLAYTMHRAGHRRTAATADGWERRGHRGVDRPSA